MSHAGDNTMHTAPRRGGGAETAPRATHTRGPWTYAFDGHGGISIETDDCDGVQIGFVSRGHEANAQLVAAAPELLEALHWFVDRNAPIQSKFNLWGPADTAYAMEQAFERARSAISKATGR